MHKSRLSHLTLALFAVLVWWDLPAAHAGELSDAVKAGDVKRVEAIICSMTRRERARPDILNGSRRKRIAAGSGMQVADVNRLVNE